MPTPIAEVSGWCNGGTRARPPRRTARVPSRWRTGGRTPSRAAVSAARSLQHQRVAGRPQQRLHNVVGQLVVPGRGAAEGQAPAGSVAAQPGRGLLDRPVQQASLTGVERVRAVDLRPAPGQSVLVQPRPFRNGEPTAIGWKAEQWSSCSRPGSSDSPERAPPPGSSAASSTVTRTPSRARATAAASPLGPPPTTRRGGHATTSFPSCWSLTACRAPARDQVTFSGIGPLGSHGCSATRSFTCQVPRSMTPSAASMTLYC